MANEASATKPDEEDGVHRLRDIVVEEVSLVDRAANKRRFLVVKRSEEMPDETEHEAAEVPAKKARRKPKIEPDEGEMEKVRRRAAPPDEDEEAEKANRPDNDEDDDGEATKKARRRASAEEDETEKAGEEDDENEDEENEDEEEEDDEVEKARARPKRPSGDAEEDGDEEVTAKAAGAHAATPKPLLRTLTKALGQLLTVTKMVQKADSGGIPDTVARELSSIAKLLGSLGGERKGSTSATVTKAGARMAKDRLDRFQKALELLSEVLKELTNAKKPAAPTAGGAEDKVAKRDSAPGIRELVASIGELTRVVKRQEDELAHIRKTRGVSNAIPIEGGRRVEAQEVSWPLDMNKPISRDSVQKAVSFYEE